MATPDLIAACVGAAALFILGIYAGWAARSARVPHDVDAAITQALALSRTATLLDDALAEHAETLARREDT